MLISYKKHTEQFKTVLRLLKDTMNLELVYKTESEKVQRFAHANRSDIFHASRKHIDFIWEQLENKNLK